MSGNAWPWFLEDDEPDPNQKWMEAFGPDGDRVSPGTPSAATAQAPASDEGAPWDDDEDDPE